MTQAEFDKLLEARFGKIRKVLASKSQDYARQGDKLHNFKQAAQMLRCTPERALVGFLTKHLVSVLDMVKDLDESKTHPLPVWEEKLGDAINYLILLEALIAEAQATIKFGEERPKPYTATDIAMLRKAGYDAVACPNCNSLKTVRSGMMWKCDSCQRGGVVMQGGFVMQSNEKSSGIPHEATDPKEYD